MNESADQGSTKPVQRRGMSRRTMIAATAWSVPAIVVVASTPAMAATPGVVSFAGVGCKHPGGSQPPFNKDYHFVLDIQNATLSNISVQLDSFLKNGVSSDFSVGAGVVPVDSTPKTITVPPGGGSYIVHLDGDDSSQASLTVNYTYDGVAGLAVGSATANPCTFEPDLDGNYP